MVVYREKVGNGSEREEGYVTVIKCMYVMADVAQSGGMR